MRLIWALVLALGGGFALTFWAASDAFRDDTLGSVLWFTLRWGFVVAVVLFCLICGVVIPRKLDASSPKSRKLIGWSVNSGTEEMMDQVTSDVAEQDDFRLRNQYDAASPLYQMNHLHDN